MTTLSVIYGFKKKSDRFKFKMTSNTDGSFAEFGWPALKNKRFSNWKSWSSYRHVSRLERDS